MKPEYAEAHYNLGLALRETGRAGAAHAEFALAQRLNPQLREP